MALSPAQKMLRKAKMGNFWRDLVIIALGIFITLLLVRMGALGKFLTATQELAYIGSFIAGIFFTSVFTLAPASIALAVISHSTPPTVVAFWGALGAMLGDLFLFLFIRDVFSEDIEGIVSVRKFKKLLSKSHFAFLKLITPVIGALIIASPLPDELGIALLGISEMRTVYLLPIAFIMNYIGILGVALIAAHM